MRDFGDSILIPENEELLVKALSPILMRDKVKKYHSFFCLLVFLEAQAAEFGGGP